MQNHGKIQRLVALIILNICVLVLVVVLCNFTHAHTASSHSGQQLHELPPHGLSYSIPVANSLHLKTLYYLTKQTSQQNPNIHVGADPEAIVEYEGKIYVLNSGDGTVSVIDGIKNTKIATIPVGGTIPRVAWNLQAQAASAIGIGTRITPSGNAKYVGIYVANEDNNTVSVIDGIKNKIGKDIPVGVDPIDIGVDDAYDIIYVANSGDDSVSVINGTDNTKIATIPVGTSPIAIGVQRYGLGKIYVAGYDSVSVIDGIKNTKIATIPVGVWPEAMGEYSGKIYVLNFDSGTVSVIDELKNTKIATIPVGEEPEAIGGAIGGKIYVANFGSNTVSVIDWFNNTKIATIPVGAGPIAIGVDELYDTVYVANSGDDSVSVINGTDNTKIATIPVGAGPRAIDVDPDTNTIYVVNSGDGSVSVIDSQANKVVAKVMFETKPFDAGRIECDKLISPIEQQFYIYSGSECTAKPYPGFGFVSWQENLGGNATQLIKLLPPPSISDSILDFFHMNSDKPEATLDITKFGNFTANFRALPPPIPPEYVATLIGVVATAFVGTWLTPALIGWRKTRTQLKYFKECINDIGIGKNKIEDKIIGYYADGKLSDVHHQLLKDKISEHYEKGSERYGAPIT
jgi:YVTN family beta-propeller protein